MNVGIIGSGYWGPNHVRIFHYMPDVEVRMCADLSQERLDFIHSLYPSVKTTRDYKELLSSPDIDAVVIATPTATHFTLTMEALQAGKHVLCEKPLAMEPDECRQLGELARQKDRILMVGHIFVFNAGIIRLKEYITKKELGRTLYAHSERTNLGPFRYDVNALWDLAPHDVSIFNYLFDSAPLSVSARGQKCLGKNLDDLAFVTLDYPGGILVNIHVSWLDPKKVRQITIVGDQKMISWDDLDITGPVRLYDKHVERTTTYYASYGEFQLLSKEGSITIPKVGSREPLKTQNQYFVECVRGKKMPSQADAEKARDVVRTLKAIQQSMDQKGVPVDVTP